MDNYKLRFIPLGGITNVTKNMYVYELYKNEALTDILIVDCGIGFPKEKELGVDFIIPDITYLLDRVDKIRGILLSHGHEDHISALRFHWEKLGKPPIYSSKLTALFVEEKFTEVGIKMRPTIIQFRKDYNFGPFIARFIHVTHSIPDTTHILLKTPVGTIYHGADFKLDLTPPYSEPPDFYEITKAGEDGVLCLLSDCLGIGREGLTLSENIVGQTFENEMRSTKGKFIMTTFSSNISRIRQCAEAAVKFNRAVCFLGRSMKDNTKLANEIGYLPIPRKFMIEDRQVPKLPPNKVCVIAAGSQGQFDSALSKISQGQSKFIKIEKTDKVFFSSDPIPGQEEDVYDLIERLYTIGADVVYSDIAERLHASGHGNQEDIKFLMRFVKAKYLLPIGGTIRHQRQYRSVARDLGYGDDRIILLKEGDTFIFEKNGVYKGQPVETKNVFVDAYGVGDVGNMVLRDRKTLSQEGIVFCPLLINNNLDLIQRPEMTSRGFIFDKDQSKIFNQAATEVIRIFKMKKNSISSDVSIKQEVIKSLESYFQKVTGRKPLVVVEVIRV